jgi:hypothetical protein
MNEVRVMTPLSRKLFCLFAILFSLSATTLTVHAGGQTVFGPNDFEIKRWRIHISLKKFRLDEPGEGRIIITNKITMRTGRAPGDSCTLMVSIYVSANFSGAATIFSKAR